MSIIELHEVTKTFGKKTALDSVSLSINAGEIFGFLGPNGAGKSTAIRSIMGFIYPDSGEIRVKNLIVDRDNSSYRKFIGYVPSDLQLNLNWTGDEHISFVKDALGLKDSMLKEIDKLSLETDEKVKNLSTGNKQKLSFLLALMARPEILILDEPTKGLDPILQEVFYEMLFEFRNEGGCVFFSSHNLTEVERLCDRIAIIRSGKIVANETMDSLHQKNVHVVKILLNGKDKIENPSTLGEVISISERTLQLRIEGEIQPFIEKVASLKFADLTIEHANLEDVFMHFYEESK